MSFSLAFNFKCRHVTKQKRYAILIAFFYCFLWNCSQLPQAQQTYFKNIATPTIYATSKLAETFRKKLITENLQQLFLEITLKGNTDHFQVENIICHPTHPFCHELISPIPFNNPLYQSITESNDINQQNNKFNFTPIYHDTLYLLQINFLGLDQIKARIKRIDISSSHPFQYYESYDIEFAYKDMGFVEVNKQCSIHQCHQHL